MLQNSFFLPPVAQWIEQRFPKPRAQVRFLSGALSQARSRSGRLVAGCPSPGVHDFVRLPAVYHGWPSYSEPRTQVRSLPSGRPSGGPCRAPRARDAIGKPKARTGSSCRGAGGEPARPARAHLILRRLLPVPRRVASCRDVASGGLRRTRSLARAAPCRPVSHRVFEKLFETTEPPDTVAAWKLRA